MAVSQPLPSEVREPYEWKLSSTVLRGERGRKTPDLPGPAMFALNEIDSRRRREMKV